ncbi:translation initiation factor IF-2 [Symphalangus syndactylus]|uniref:translation initiation factor IF-2 n=1 Tax=Symphalangus syndactylus TaxID=9590 RepID=UPI00300618E6
MPAEEMPPRAGKGARKRGGAGHGAQGPSLPPRTQLIGLELPPGRGRRAGPRLGGAGDRDRQWGLRPCRGSMGGEPGRALGARGPHFGRGRPLPRSGWARPLPVPRPASPVPRPPSPSPSPAAAKRGEVPGPAAAGSRAPRSRSRAARALPWRTARLRGARRGRPCPTLSRALYGASSAPFTCQLLGKLKSRLGGGQPSPTVSWCHL